MVVTEADSSIVVVQLREMRRELTAMREYMEMFGRQMNRLADAQVGLQQSMVAVEATVGSLRVQMSEVRSELILLDNRNLSRHNEILSILTRLSAVERAVGTAVGASKPLDLDPNKPFLIGDDP